MFRRPYLSAPFFVLSPRLLLLGIALLTLATLGASAPPDKSPPGSSPSAVSPQALDKRTFLPVITGGQGAAPGSYVLVGWNDLGMHCYNYSFKDLVILPPYNNLWAQVIKRGDPPQIVTSGIRVEYSFPGNTTSVGKTDFWQYADQLFGPPLANDVGLKGKGLTGTMDPNAGYFVAEGIPLTEYSDSAPTTRDPYQLASLVAKDIATGAQLATLSVVAPVSSEMHCDNCHKSTASLTTETRILNLHDNEEGTHLAANRPVLCANCHADPILGLPGSGEAPSLSRAIHRKHTGISPDTLDGCYNCHPGPTTLCLRDVMSQTVTSSIDPSRKMNCIDCHGGMSQVAQNPNPWFNEPRCDTCHQPTATHQYNQDQALFRLSKGHGGLYCEACHDSTHAIATSRESKDAIKFIQLQGTSGTLSKCTVCHLTQPTGAGPHSK